MKSNLATKGKHLNMYVEDMTVEFYVKGSRTTTAKIDAEGTVTPAGFMKTLVIKPSYSHSVNGEAQNKITIKFKSTYGLAPAAKKEADECMRNNNCVGTHSTGGEMG